MHAGGSDGVILLEVRGLFCASHYLSVRWYILQSTLRTLHSGTHVLLRVSDICHQMLDLYARHEPHASNKEPEVQKRQGSPCNDKSSPRRSSKSMSVSTVFLWCVNSACLSRTVYTLQPVVQLAVRVSAHCRQLYNRWLHTKRFEYSCNK